VRSRDLIRQEGRRSRPCGLKRAETSSPPLDNPSRTNYNAKIRREPQKKPFPSEGRFSLSAVVAGATILAPTIWFAQSAWTYSGLLNILWPVASTIAWLFVLDGYEGEWRWDDWD
jgi:hypothetical protein